MIAYHTCMDRDYPNRKKAVVTPLFKKGNRIDPANYRPISLTSVCCKLLEHIIHSNNI